MEEIALLRIAGTDPLETAPKEETTANKDGHINLRIAATDKQAIERRAVRTGLKTGEFIRRAALGKVIVERIPPDLRREIGLVSSNLNQLSHLANTGKLSGVGIEQLNELVNRLLKTLR